MATYGGPDIVTDGLILYLDPFNPKSIPYSGITAVGAINVYMSNGTLTAQEQILPNGSTGIAVKVENTVFTNTVTVRNQDFNCEGTSIMEVFVKPVEYFYVKLRDGGTTNLQVDFDLTTGTIVGGNNSNNGTITSYPNGWFLLTMTVPRVTSFNFGTRIVIYPNNSFSPYDSIKGSGVLIYNLSVKSVSSSIIKDLSNNNLNGRVINGTSNLDGSFILDGVNDYIDMGGYTYTNYYQHTATDIFNTSDKLKIGGEIFQKGRRRDFAIRQYSNIGTLEFRYVTNDISYTYYGFSLENNKWYIATMSIDTTNGGKFKCYVNGLKVYETNITTTTTLKEDLFYTNQLISGKVTSNSELFEGKVGGLMMYDRQLIDEEVLQNYNTLRPRFNL